MTKRIEDLVAEFPTLTYEEQVEKIRRIRDARTIERPVAAVKRVKKQAKKKAERTDKSNGLLASLTPEQKAALIKKLSASLGEKK